MPRPPRIGVQLPEVERDVRWPEYLALARAAEEAGFGSVWLGDHLLYRGDGGRERGPWDVWTLLAALAASTERVEIGPLVASTAFHPPGLLARMAAAVDEIAGGRLILGLGAGWNVVEYRAFGLPFDRPVSRFEEAFAIVRRLLAGERVTVAGRFYAVDDAVLLPPPARRVPLMVGSIGPRMLAIALPHVDAWNTWWSQYGNRAEGFAELNRRVDEAAAAAGRDPAEIRRSACVLVTLDPQRRERPLDETPRVPVERLAAHLDELADAGADEAILVLEPVDEPSIRHAAEALGLQPRRALGGSTSMEQRRAARR